MGRESLTTAELVERTKKRVHDVLTVYPGSGLGALHTAVRPYNTNWRIIFEEMIAQGDVRREAVKFASRIQFKFYTNEPTGEVVVVQSSVDT